MRTSLPLLLALALVPLLSGCLALGLGAAATVGGCALLDEDQDDEVTTAEFSAGLFDAWDDDGDGTLTEAEFSDGTSSSDTYAAWGDDFDGWDGDGDGTLTEAEFSDGVGGSGDVAAMLDDGCDDLGL